MTVADIAVVTGLSEPTVKRRWQAARAWLSDASHIRSTMTDIELEREAIALFERLVDLSKPNVAPF